MNIRRLVPWTLSALFFASCQTAPPPPPSASSPVKPPKAAAKAARRVILLSLDGAAAEELHKLYKAGGLKAGGFSRFFEEGQVADRLIPVDPPLTSVNHISLATGYTPDQTGIVGNTFHPAGKPFLETASGFTAPIATETLWEAAKRQGLKVGVTTWPGADGNGTRRTADWGMIYVNDADRRSQLVDVPRLSWNRADALTSYLGIKTFSPLYRAQVKIATDQSSLQVFDLLALDRTDDQAANYDGILIAQSRGNGHPDLGEPLGVGGWEDRPCEVRPLSSPGREAVCPIKLLALDPDLKSVRVYFGGVYPVVAYPPDFQNALRGLVWPGPPDDHSLSDTWAGRPGIDLKTWLEQSDRFTRFFGDSLLAAVKQPAWDLIMGYVPVIDEAGHQLSLANPRQPGYTQAKQEEFAAARLRVWQDVDRELARLLAAVDLSTTAVVIVSDHGMTPTHTQVDPNVILRQNGFLAINAQGKVQENGTVAYAVNGGGIVHVYAPNRADLLPTLRTLFADWLVDGEKPVERILTRQEAAEAYLGLDNPNSGDLILFLNEGYSAHGSLLKEDKASAPSAPLGMHGYLNIHPDMHAIYMAIGSGIPKELGGRVSNPEVAGRVADLLGIEKPRPAP